MEPSPPRHIHIAGGHLYGIAGVRDLAWRLPGHDWAQTTPALGAGKHPWPGRELHHRATKADIAGPYAANLMLAAGREHERHRHDPATGVARTIVRTQLEMAREHLRRVYEEYW